MISELRISGLGVIADATLDLHRGLTAVTGETGAGKTMVVTGLGLLLGQRADPGAVRTGLDRARVEGRVDLPTRLVPIVEDAGGSTEDGELLVARQITATAGGRSRCWVGGAQVPLATCGDLLGELVTIHGQSEQLKLASPEHQRAMVDRAAGEAVAVPLTAYQKAWQQRRTVVAELTDLTEAARERAREADMLQHALEEISAVNPQPGEDTELAAESTRLQDADDLRAAAQTAVQALAGDEDDPSSGALAAVAVAERSIVDLASRDTLATEMVEEVRQVRILLDDLTGGVVRYLDQLEADPARLETVIARRAALAGLTRKYGATVDEVLDWGARGALRLEELAGSDDRITELAVERDRLDAELDRLAGAITTARTEAAARLVGAIGVELAALAMPRARLDVVIEPLAERGPYGADRVELRFSANPGSEPRPIGKVASGGELSRVRLALEVVLADQAQQASGGSSDQTYVFDEVDSGVGGAVAVEIGRRLAALARHSQVIVVTHLAQVAAFADRHLVVAKADDGQITTSGVRAVDDEDRAAELARMMAGLETTAASRAHAEELLAEAGRSRADVTTDAVPGRGGRSGSGGSSRGSGSRASRSRVRRS